MKREILVVGTSLWLSGVTTAAFAAAGAAFPNVDVRAITAPGNVTQQQLDAQGTKDESPTGILQFVVPGLYAPAPATSQPASVAAAAPDGTTTVEAQAAPSAPGLRSVTRYFLPGLQGSPAGEVHYGGMQR